MPPNLPEDRIPTLPVRLKRVLGLAFALSAAAAMTPFGRACAAESLDAIAERATKLGEGWAAIAADNSISCDVMADKLGKYSDDKGALVKETTAALMAASKKATPEQKNAMVTKYEPRMEATSNQIAAGTTRCRANTKVSTQYTRWLKIIRGQ